MTSKKFSLPVQSTVTNIPFDFAFIVGYQQYPCAKISAINLCRTVQNLLLCDSTCTEMTITTPDNNGFFKNFIDFVNGGKEVVLNKQNIIFFRNLSVELQCDKLAERIYNVTIQNAKVSIVFENLIESNPYQNDVEKYLQAYQYELRFIASKLSELIKNTKFDKFNKVPLEVIEVILDPKIRCTVQWSDLFSLVYAIVKLNEKDERYLSLFSQIPFEQIDSKNAKQFYEMIKGKEVSGSLWLAMTKRLKCNVK